jgi:hypothetical protein
MAMTEQTDGTVFSGSQDKLGEWWCSFMHASPMWPIHGHYECGICGRRYRVPWAEGHSGLPVFRQALAPVSDHAYRKL